MSIRTRLTIWYIGLLAIVLVAFGLLLYATLSNSLLGSVDRLVETQGQQIISIASRRALLQLVVGVPGGLPSPLDPFSAPGVFIQVSDAKGQPRTRSDNLRGATLPLDKATQALVDQGKATIKTVEVGGARLRVYTAPIISENQLVGYIQVAAPLREAEGTLQQLATLLIGGTIFTLALAALIGAFMARATLRPIDDITRTALRIARTEDLGRRIDGVRGQDEVGRLAATFNEMLGRIELLFRTQQRFIADISHELRTPLTTIRGNLDLLDRQLRRVPGLTLTPMYGDMNVSLVAIRSESDRMSRLVNDLLVLAQADAGVTLKSAPVELDSLLLDVYRQARVIADGVTVTLGNEDQAIVEGDADRLKQLLLNLVDNAIKYTPKGGQVTLSLFREDGWVRVEVADTGIGIPEEDLPHVFERFYRVDKARSREKGGTGLGLSIAQWIAHAHGGEITVGSGVGQGTTFTIWLPAGREPVEAAADLGG